MWIPVLAFIFIIIINISGWQRDFFFPRVEYSASA